VTHSAEESASGPSAHFAIVIPDGPPPQGDLAPRPGRARAMFGYWLARERAGAASRRAFRLIVD
jgi:hypothetical protein